jgi:hypothetical protein
MSVRAVYVPIRLYVRGRKGEGVTGYLADDEVFVEWNV